MAYATHSDITNVMRIQMAADLSADSGIAPDNDVLDAILVDASAIMDGYLGGRYTIPISGAAALAALKVYCLAIGRYLAMTRSGVQRYDQAAKDRYDDAVRYLRDIAMRKLSLPGVSDAVVDEATTSSGRSGSMEQVFDDPSSEEVMGIL